jgi:hypothetical protein
VKSLAQSLADAVRAARDENYFAFDIHIFCREKTRNFTKRNWNFVFLGG